MSQLLTLIRVGFLGFRFRVEGGGGGEIPHLSKTCGTQVNTQVVS